MSIFKENKHSILVHCLFQEAYPEIVLWGEASWWPKGSLMRFVRKDSGPVAMGTRYRQQVLLPFAPAWDVEVGGLDAGSITRQLLNGMFSGSETISLEPAGPEIEIRYVMRYQINGVINKVMWPLVFERLHNRNIEEILSNLKKYLEKK